MGSHVQGLLDHDDSAGQIVARRGARWIAVVVSVEVVDRDVIRIPQAVLYTASGLLIRVTPTAMIMPGNNTLSRRTFDRSGGAAIALATR